MTGDDVSESNRQIRLAARPQGECKPEDWEHADAPLQAPGDGQFAGRTLAVSLDPAMRGWLDDRPSYLPPVGIGEVMRAGSVLEVTDSKHPDYAPGDHVVGVFGAQTHALSDGRGAMKVDLGIAPASTYLGALGMPGMTAYFGLLEIGALQEGETVVISGAAGAVGTVAGQIAKIKGCRVVGIAGGPEKCAMLVDELGFDAAIDYKADDVGGRLRELAPDGVGVFIDNVGGDVLDAVLLHLARGARVVISGGLSQYNADRATGPSNYLQLLWRRASMTGFLTPDYEDRYPAARAELAALLQDGRLISREQIVDGGVRAFPELLPMVFGGANTGKLILAI
jgi:NADPH-dependent curcumin reductase CurA